MTFRDLLAATYAWADANAATVFLVALAVPVVGTLAARIGKGGRTDADGRVIASVVMGAGLLVLAGALVSAWFAHSVMGESLMDANALLLMAPLLSVTGCVVGIHAVFPLNQLASVRTFADIGVFVGACLAALWMFSKFRGWGIVFFGSIFELVVIFVLGYFLIRRLYRRAFR